MLNHARSRATAATVRFVCAVIFLGVFFPPALVLLALTPWRFRRAFRKAAASPTNAFIDGALGSRPSRVSW